MILYKTEVNGMELQCRKEINISVYYLTDLKSLKNRVVTGLDAKHFYNTNDCMKSIVLWDPWVPITSSSQNIVVPIIRNYEEFPSTNFCFKVIKNPSFEYNIPTYENAIIIMVSAKILFRIADYHEMDWIDYLYSLMGYPKVLAYETTISQLISLYNHTKTVNSYRLQNDVWIVVTDLEDFNGAINHNLWPNYCQGIPSCRVVFFQPYGCYKSMSMMMKTIVARNLGG